MTSLDIATSDKIPVIQHLLGSIQTGLALDIGCGTGYTTRQVFSNAKTVYLDGHRPNLLYCRDNTIDGTKDSLVESDASILPFDSETFDYVLCSEVLEHLEDDDAAVAEIARVLRSDGRVVITVPYEGLGFTSFLELIRIKTVHDFPGPEFHVRPGYDEVSMRNLLARHGLEIEEMAFYFRFFTRIVADCVSLAHIVYQRLIRGRSSWTWSDAMEAEDSLPVRFYRIAFPILRWSRYLDKLVARRRGFGLVVSARKSVQE